MIKPYYDHKNITIYHGDCLEILPQLDKVDLVLTDPPYGINLETAYRLRGRGRLAQCKNYPVVYGDDKPFNPEFLMEYKNIILFGANYYCDHLKPSSGWIVWDKRRGRMQNDQADAEIAWTNCIKGVRLFSHEWNGFRRDSERGESYHPTQKPVALFEWILNLRWLREFTNILDPFMGSGSVLIAAKLLNRKAIGIEIEEKYCEIAVKRLGQEVFEFK